MVKRMFIATLVAIGPLLALAQNVITGRVIDAKTGEPLIGASVIVKTDRQGVATDVDGNFSLTTNKEFPLTLHLDFVGYRGLDLDVYDNSEPVEIKLQENYRFTEEIVVIGYGQQKRSDLTGSISVVSAEQIKKIASSSFDNALAGTVAGLQATPTSGQPGGGISLRIRGGNSIQGGNEPLYVIDGFPIYNTAATAGTVSGATLNPLSAINPGDIESINVLKDASATAIYGSRGANGVIIITTKKGASNQASVTYEGSVGWQSLQKKISVLNAHDFAVLRNEALYDTNPERGAYQYMDQDAINSLGDGTDWQDAAFRTAMVTNHQLSIIGGNEKTKYAISGNYYDQDGIIINTGFTRFSGRVNLDSKISRQLTVGINASVSQSNAKVSPSGIVSGLILMPATATIYEADGSYTLRNPFENDFSNPIASLKEQTNKTRNFKFLGTAFGEYSFLPELRFKVLFGANIDNGRETRYIPSVIFEGAPSNGIASIGYVYSQSWLNENTLTYDKIFKKVHNLSLLAGFTQQKTTIDITRTGSSYFVSDDLTYNSLQSGSVVTTPHSSATENTLISFIGRINYNYADQHFLSFSIRGDGSSRFGSSNKWGVFPSAGYSWNLTKAPFLYQQKEWLSNLKLRLSYGVTGNQEIGNYQSLSTMSSVTYNFGDTNVIGYKPDRIPNEALSWETTHQFDAGIDLGFWNNRLNVTLDYYYKKTKDLLLDVEIPLTTGFSKSLQNYGSVVNQGFELSINSLNFTGEFTWNTLFNLSLNRNKVLEIGNGADSYLSGNYIVQVGQPLGSFYGALTDGILQEGEESSKGTYTGNGTPKAGDRLYKDVNNDGTFTTSSDRVIIGSAQPDFVFGLSNEWTWKGFDLSIFLQGTVGNEIINGNRQSLEIFNGQQNADTYALERWTPSKPSLSVPRAKMDPAPVFSDRLVEDGSFLRIKNVTLGYTIPSKIVKRLKLSNVHLYASATNLLTLTSYSGFDPEVTSGDNTISQGTDSGIYPVSRTYTIGISIKF